MKRRKKDDLLVRIGKVFQPRGKSKKKLIPRVPRQIDPVKEVLGDF